MTTTRVIRREANDTSDPDIAPSSVSQGGTGVSWNLSTKRITLQNGSPNSKRFDAFFETDLRVTDDVFNIPADRCIVTYKCRPNITSSVNGGGLGVIFDIDYGTGSAFGGESRIDETSTGSPNFPLFDLVQTGSAVTTVTANQNTITEDQCTVNIQINTSNNNSNGLHSVTIELSDVELRANTGSAGSLNRKWEADNHVIDGVGGDTIDPINVAATMTAIPTTQRFAEASASSSFSIAADTKNLKLATATPSSVASLAVTPKYIADSSKTLNVISEVLSSTDNLVRLDVESYATTTSITISPTFKPSGETALASVGSSNITGNQIFDIGGDYTWDTINEIALASENFWDDITSWETWPDATWGSALESWDEWDLNVWARSYNIISTFEEDLSDVTFKPAGVSSVSSAFGFSENSALEERAEADLNVTITIEPTAAGILEGGATLTGAFSPTLTDGVIFDQPSAVTITGAFTPVLTANATFSGETALSVSSAFSITPTHRRGPFQLTFTSAFTQPDTIPSRKLGPFQLVLPALASTLITSRLFYQTDPFNIAKVDEETRIVVIPQETRITAIDQENRVNNITQETRVHLVSQETRRHKLKIPPIKDRFSTPKTRVEV